MIREINWQNKKIIFKKINNKIELKWKSQNKPLLLQKNKECWESTNRWVDRFGYSRIRIKKKTERIHRLLYCIFQNIPLKAIKGYSIRHMCDNRICCNPAHLIKGTHQQNMQDKYVENKIKNQELTDHIKQCIIESEMDIEYLSSVYGINIKKVKEIINEHNKTRNSKNLQIN